MRAAVFFMYLCFLLLRGNDPVYAGTQYNSARHSLIQHAEKEYGVSFADEHVIKDTSPDTEKEYFISDDVEDEDEDVNIFFAGKYRLPARWILTGSYPSILNYLCNCFKAPPSFCGQASYKYILQGALRI